MSEEALKGRANAVGADWSWLSRLAPVVIDAILRILEEVKNAPKASSGVQCPPTLADHLRAAHTAALNTVCATCCALTAAGIDHPDHNPDDEGDDTDDGGEVQGKKAKK